ncbi:MAG: twin-arginine translocation signal domain-containing protein [Hyalangium sp.]|uniref:twin-arginine translocation signal domain-containing protein n=1 Tax=Hyalangium sp. TaxID=2028555 RepID=UPI00389A7808
MRSDQLVKARMAARVKRNTAAGNAAQRRRFMGALAAAGCSLLPAAPAPSPSRPRAGAHPGARCPGRCGSTARSRASTAPGPRASPAARTRTCRSRRGSAEGRDHSGCR